MIFARYQDEDGNFLVGEGLSVIAAFDNLRHLHREADFDCQFDADCVTFWDAHKVTARISTHTTYEIT